MSDETAADGPVWTGRLTRGDAPGTIVGFLDDCWKWRIHITGVLDTEHGGYVLTGKTGKVPDSLTAPIIDDPITKDG